MTVFKQARFLRGMINVEIQQPDRLSLIAESVFESRAETYNLFDLSEKFDRQFTQPLQWGGSAVLAALATVSFAAGWLSLPGVSTGLSIGICAATALSCVAAYLYHCVEYVVLRHRITGDVLCKIWVDQQSRSQIDSWLTSLRSHIHAARIHPEASNESRLEAHKDALEFLLNEDVLSAEEARGIYERNKTRLTERAPAKLYAIK